MTNGYFDLAGRSDVLTGGVRMIPVETPAGTFRVWTKRVGSNPRVKLLLLHGGPGITHEYFEACDSWLTAAGVEYYYYDQLGSYYSDQPDVPELWELPRFVDEVEQVRAALGQLEGTLTEHAGTSSCWASRGAASSRRSTRSRTRSTSAGSSSRT